MRISDWSSDVCSSDLVRTCGSHKGAKARRFFQSVRPELVEGPFFLRRQKKNSASTSSAQTGFGTSSCLRVFVRTNIFHQRRIAARSDMERASIGAEHRRSEEHTSELQSLMRTSYAV